MNKKDDAWKKEKIEKEARNIGVALKEEQCAQLLLYYELLVQWNQSMNLTAITAFEEVVVKHFVDSLALAGAIRNAGRPLRVIDVGTGAGFPGLPLKIAFPQWDMVLMDSLQKRAVFLEHVVRALALERVEVCHGRAEDYGKKPGYRERFDLSVSRAVAHLSVLSEYCIPFVEENGHFVAYKACAVKQEIEEAQPSIELLGGKPERIVEFSLP